MAPRLTAPQNLEVATKDADQSIWKAVQTLIWKIDDLPVSSNRKKNASVLLPLVLNEVEGLYTELKIAGTSLNTAYALHKAVKSCDEAVVLLLLKLGADINFRDNRDRTPLHIAAEWNNDIIMCLVQNGANGELQDLNGDTALSIVSRSWRRRFNVFRQTRTVVGNDVIVEYLRCMKSLTPKDEARILLEGWLSPRMVKKLTEVAEIEGKALAAGNGNLTFIPPHVLYAYLVEEREAGTSDFIKGYAECFKVIASLLRSGRAPTVKRIKRRLSQSVHSSYLERGGKVEYALDAILNISWEWSNENRSIQNELFIALPSTPFDEAYELAKVMTINLGGGKLKKGGPYVCLPKTETRMLGGR